MSADGTIPEARTSAFTSSWYTPAAIVEAARLALGGTIDLDPASCAVANRTVMARRFFTAADDGLAIEWGKGGTIFCNPPSPPRPWWDLVNGEVLSGRWGRAVFVGYSIEALQQFQRGGLLNHWHMCIPSKRIRYETTAGERVKVLQWRQGTPALKRQLEALLAVPPDTLVTGDAPAHASVVFGYGMADFRFKRAFAAVGVCR